MINDIPTLQNMVKKRDEIIRNKTADINNYIEEIITLKEGKELPEDSDYRECCEQLKAATGEIARLEEVVSEQLKNLEYHGNKVTELQKQLDRDTELEDTLGKPIEALKLMDKIKKDHTNEIEVLEEKLSMCDGYYKVLVAIVADAAYKLTESIQMGNLKPKS